MISVLCFTQVFFLLTMEDFAKVLWIFLRFFITFVSSHSSKSASHQIRREFNAIFASLIVTTVVYVQFPLLYSNIKFFILYFVLFQLHN